MAQGVASENLWGNLSKVRLFFLFFQALLCLQHVCAPTEHKGKNRMSVEHITPHSLLYYSLNICGCGDDSGAQTLAELWENERDKGPIRGLFCRDAYSLGKSFLSVRHSMLITYFQSSNHGKLRMTLCSQLEMWVRIKRKRENWKPKLRDLKRFTTTYLQTRMKWTSMTRFNLMVEMEDLKRKK